jgi:hypothetical protein
MNRALPCAFVLAIASCGGDDDDAATTQAVDEPPVTGVCPPDSDRGDAFADCVESFAPAEPASFGHDEMPEIVLGPPVPSPAGAGSTDIASLGCGGSITLAFDPPGVVDIDGVDLVVFENAFAVGDETFAEPARVLVSEDGVAWRELACSPSGDGEWPPDGCAGVEPARATDAESALDPARSGGDGFDLADVGLERARYVRLVDVTREHYGDDMWCGGAGGGFDLDAIAAPGGDE